MKTKLRGLETFLVAAMIIIATISLVVDATAGSPPDQPYVRIETGAHTAAIPAPTNA